MKRNKEKYPHVYEKQKKTLADKRKRMNEGLEELRQRQLARCKIIKRNPEEIKIAIEKANEKKLVVKNGLNCYTQNV